MSYMVDIFNRLGNPGGLNATLPAPTPAPSAAEGAFGGLMGNFASPTPQAPQAPQGPNPQGAFNGIMGGLPSAPPAPPGPGPFETSISGPATKEEQFLVQCGIPPQTAKQICGTGMQQPTLGGGTINQIEMPLGGNGREGYRTANGDAGLQGANMPPKSSSWTNPSPWTSGLTTSGMGGNDNGWMLPSTSQQGGGGMWGGVTRPTPQQGGPMSYGMFGGGAPQGNPMQMPSAPFQSGMRAGSVGNQMGGLNNMYSNFAAPSPMPAPPPPMFGAPAGNSRAMMGPKPVGLF